MTDSFEEMLASEVVGVSSASVMLRKSIARGAPSDLSVVLIPR